MNEEEIKVSWETYIGFPATAGEIEVQGDPQVFKCLQFITEAFSGKLPQGVLVPLGCLFHLPFLQDTWRANTWWGRGENQKEKRKNVGKRSRPRHPPDTPTIAVLWLKSSLLINHTYNKQTSSDKTHTHTHTLTSYTWQVCPFCCKLNLLNVRHRSRHLCWVLWNMHIDSLSTFI